MRRTSDSATNAVHVLVALRAVLCEINSGPKHTANVSMSLVETLLHDRINKWTAVEKHPFAGLVAVLLRNLATAMRVALPELAVLHLLDLK